MRCHEFCHVLQVAVSLNTSYHLWFSDSEQSLLFRQILVLSVFMPLWPRPQHKKRFRIHWAPQPVSTPPTQLPCTTCKWAMVSLLLESIRLTPSQRQRGPGHGGGEHGQDCGGSLSSRRAAGPPPGSWPAYLGVQTLLSVGEDVGGFPAAGGQVQDGRSCCDVGVFTALAGAVGAGTAWALCVGACTRQPGGKFPWTGKMLRCWREIRLAIAQTWIYSLNRLVWKTELLAWKYVKNTQKHNPFSLCTLNECYSDWFSLEFIYQTRWLWRRKAYSLNIFCIYTFYEKNCNSGYWARALAAQVVKMVDSSLR